MPHTAVLSMTRYIHLYLSRDVSLYLFALPLRLRHKTAWQQFLQSNNEDRLLWHQLWRYAGPDIIRLYCFHSINPCTCYSDSCIVVRSTNIMPLVWRQSLVGPERMQVSALCFWSERKDFHTGLSKSERPSYYLICNWIHICPSCVFSGYSQRKNVIELSKSNPS